MQPFVIEAGFPVNVPLLVFGGEPPRGGSDHLQTGASFLTMSIALHTQNSAQPYDGFMVKQQNPSSLIFLSRR